MIIGIPKIVSAISWDDIEGEKDLEAWDCLTGNFWLSEKIPLSNDIPSWKTLNVDGKLMTNRVFTGLTLLDTIRGTVGAVSLTSNSRTPHEEAICTSIAFMELVHAKSYSSTFSTPLSAEEISKSFQRSENNEFLQKKVHIVLDYYHGNDAEKRKVASAVLESFLLYSGFYTPMYWSTYAKSTNTTDLIRLITRDEAAHGYYISYKFQVAIREPSSSRQEELRNCMYPLLTDLYGSEMLYIETLYDTLGLTEDVKKFLRYSTNKTLMGLGHEALFPPEEIDVDPTISAAPSPAAEESHDFLSGSGSLYTIGAAGETEDKDWEF